MSRVQSQNEALRYSNELRDRSLAERAMLESDWGSAGSLRMQSEAADEGREYGAAVFEAQAGSLERQQRALGGMSERQAAAQTAQLGLRRSLAEVGTANRAIMQEQDRATAIGDLALMRRDQYAGASLGMVDMAAEHENQRNIQRKLRKASRSAGRIGAIGKVAGMGLAYATGGPGALALTAFGSAPQ